MMIFIVKIDNICHYYAQIVWYYANFRLDVGRA